MKFVTSLDSPVVREALLPRFDEIMQSGMYAEGKYTEKAELALATYLKAPALTMNSCGSALLTAFRYYKQMGCVAVLMQNNTFWATASMAREAGLEVVLVDSRSDCPSMSVDSLKDAILNSCVVGGLVVCLTHVGGWVAKDYDEIVAYCGFFGLPLVEDCAHVFGNPEYHAREWGTQCWSFYPTKAVPVGDAGALTTSNYRLFKWASRFRAYGKYLDVNGTMCYGEGQNLRISEFNAAVLDYQISRVGEIVALRSACADSLQLIAPCALTGPSNYYKYPVYREHLLKGLKHTSGVYAPTDQIEYVMPEAHKPVPLKNSQWWAKHHVCLPVGEDLYAGMTASEIDKALAA